MFKNDISFTLEIPWLTSMSTGMLLIVLNSYFIIHGSVICKNFIKIEKHNLENLCWILKRECGIKFDRKDIADLTSSAH